VFTLPLNRPKFFSKLIVLLIFFADPLSMYLCTPVLLNSMPALPSGGGIEGIAVFDNEVYTVRDKIAEVQVYDIERLEVRRRFPLPGSQPQDLVVCAEARLSNSARLHSLFKIM